MAISIKVSDKVSFTVVGQTNDADGESAAFEFTLTAHRLGDKALQALQSELSKAVAKDGNHNAVTDKLCAIDDAGAPVLITNWQGVRDATDAPLAFNPQNLRTLLDSYRGLNMLVWHTYLRDSGAKEKN